MLSITRITGDITSLAADAIVNAANSSLLGGGGVDGAIHRKAGPALLKACQEIRYTLFPDGLATGEAVITPGFNLPARYVIHTVGPVWRGGDQGEPRLLANAYRHSLMVAAAHQLESVAFPAISTGVYGYPKDLADEVATRTVNEFLATQGYLFTQILFVTFG